MEFEVLGVVHLKIVFFLGTDTILFDTQVPLRHLSTSLSKYIASFLEDHNLN